MVKKGHMRMTRQRQVILEELRKVTSHPTADEIYNMVRELQPNISLGTIYRNLDVLTESGMIQRIETDGERWRFDGNPENHYHVRCIRCGRVDDVHEYPVMTVDDKIIGLTGYEIMGHRLDFWGICPDCKVDDNEKDKKGKYKTH